MGLISSTSKPFWILLAYKPLSTSLDAESLKVVHQPPWYIPDVEYAEAKISCQAARHWSSWHPAITAFLGTFVISYNLFGRGLFYPRLIGTTSDYTRIARQ
ncbi:hypothetical protein FRC12_018991 [Ceratobasidium sp. 428]|nr:hypothetical protein FRC12_018991 [Ceratobasidium sp. 428]